MVRHITAWCVMVLLTACSQTTQITLTPTRPLPLPPQPTAQLSNTIVTPLPTPALSDIQSADDIPVHWIESEQQGNIIFRCNLDFRAVSDNVSDAHRLCEFTANDTVRLIQSRVYAITSDWSPDGDWYVYVGAQNEFLAGCEQTLYAYLPANQAIVDLLQDTEIARRCGFRNLTWREENSDIWLHFDVWTGGDQFDDASYETHNIRFAPASFTD